MTDYNWTNDPTKSGTPVNVDKLNSNLMHLKQAIDNLQTNYVKGGGVNVWVGTQPEYDALTNYDSRTLYIIED